jgi:hypothetical protein
MHPQSAIRYGYRAKEKLAKLLRVLQLYEEKFSEFTTDLLEERPVVFFSQLEKVENL